MRMLRASGSGVNATGLPFNSLAAIERSDGRTNQSDGQLRRDRHDQPRARGDTAEQGGGSSSTGLSRFAGRALAINEEVLASASQTNARNQAIGQLLRQLRPASTSSRPRRSISTPGNAGSNVTAKDLAVMGATLADGGVNPLTRERVVDADDLQGRAGGDGDGRACTKRRATGSTTSACRARAASAAGS